MNALTEVMAGAIDQIHAHQAPWQHSWPPGVHFMPVAMSGQRYGAINAVILSAAALDAGYHSTCWASEAALTKVGAQPLPDERPTQIVAWQFTDAQGARLERPRVTLREVWNAEQTTVGPIFNTAMISVMEQTETLRQIIGAADVNIAVAAGTPARYDARTDTIWLPQDPADQLIAAVHGLTHWTGHPKRLDRGTGVFAPPGSKEWAREELRTNIASLFLADRMGTGWDPSGHNVYAAAWSQIVEADPTELLRAALSAEVIAEHLVHLGLERAPDLTDDAMQQMARTVHDTQTAVTQEHPAMTPRLDVLYLVVPFEEKDAARAAGARWDKQAKAWYVTADAERGPIEAWLPKGDNIVITTDGDPRQQFTDQLRQAGFVLDDRHPVMDGKIHRCAVDGDTGRERNGAYQAFMDGRPNGWHQNHKTTDKPMRWKAGVADSLTPRERAELAAQAATARRASEADREARAQQAARVATDILAAAQPATDHPYLERKGVEALGLFVAAAATTVELTGERGPYAKDIGGSILIPVRDATGAVTSLQIIDPGGSKMFLPGGTIAGGRHVIGTLDSAWPIHIAEGYATAAAVHAATGQAVAVAFHAHNIGAVAADLRAAYPERTIYIDADNDHHLPLRQDAQGRPRANVGVDAATKAADAIKAHVLTPPALPGRETAGTDWNDVARSNPEGWQAKLATAMAIAARHRMAAEIAQGRHAGGRGTKDRRRMAREQTQDSPALTRDS